jgi:hypothetical protein
MKARPLIKRPLVGEYRYYFESNSFFRSKDNENWEYLETPSRGYWNSTWYDTKMVTSGTSFTLEEIKKQYPLA